MMTYADEGANTDAGDVHPAGLGPRKHVVRRRAHDAQGVSRHTGTHFICFTRYYRFSDYLLC
jgi:hypothetical protein